jgi:predicted ATP-dependent protease
MEPVPQQLSADQLRRSVDPQTLDLQSPAHPAPAGGIIGQERAVAALRFGLSIHDGGFNIYVAGPPGIGKMTTVRQFVAEFAARQAAPDDWCYLNNFDDPSRPLACRLPAGQGRQVQQDMRSLIAHARTSIPNAFESDEYTQQRTELANRLNTARETLLTAFNERAGQVGFALKIAPFGMILVPIVQGRPMSDEEFAALPDPAREDLIRRRDTLQVDLEAVMKQGRELERTAQRDLEELDRKVALSVVGALMDDLDERYGAHPELAAYLAAVRQDILNNITLFRTPSAAEQREAETAPAASWLKELPFRRYTVNVVVDRSRQRGAPVVVEQNPTFANLCGRIEKESQFGTLATDFSLIKAGSLHQANGGFLVVPVEALLRDPLSWDGLKRALRSKAVEIEEPLERLGYLTTHSLRPQPIPLDVKVVLVGPTLFHRLLHAYDSEYPELFKVSAEFDTRMPWNEQNQRDLLRLFTTSGASAGFLPLDAPAAAVLIEHAARLAEDRTKLSTHLGMLSNLLREANFWAVEAGSDHIGAAHVQRALEQQVYRSKLIQEHIEEFIARGVIALDLTGEQVGQITGLSVINLGEYAFGRPSRITCSVGAGREGVVDIEREVELGGPLHSKGVLILSGYLTQHFAQDKPLTLAARLVFEQSYEGVEGDSASAAELCALLSALGNVPIRQGIAMTGSVNQHGVIQAIGGVNAKIEGYFDVCRALGLPGAQGVIIPASNVEHLMLRPDVVEAVRAGQFRIWAVHTVAEAMQVLTGIPLGARDVDRLFTPETISYRVDERLRSYVEAIVSFSNNP